MNRSIKLLTAFAAAVVVAVDRGELCPRRRREERRPRRSTSRSRRWDGSSSTAKASRSTTSHRTRARRASATARAPRSGRRYSRRASRVAGPGVRAVAARHDEAQGRQARGHLQRSPALLLRRATASPARRPARASTSSAAHGGSSRRQARRSTVASAARHAAAAPPSLARVAWSPGVARGVECRGEIARYLGAVSILVVGAIHAQQYYYAYFYVVPTIGTLFLLSFIGAGVVGAVLFAPVRRLGRRVGDLILVLAALGRDRDRARDARQPPDQRVHAALRVHGVGLPPRDRPHARLRRSDDGLPRRLPRDRRAGTHPKHSS